MAQFWSLHSSLLRKNGFLSTFVKECIWYCLHIWKYSVPLIYPSANVRAGITNWPMFVQCWALPLDYSRTTTTVMFTSTDTVVFCRQRRPFESMQLPAPCETEKMLKMQYTNLDVCKSKNHNHRHEVAYPSFMRYSLPCSSLKQKFPFVERTEEMGSTRETLRLGHWTINTVLIPPCRGRWQSYKNCGTFAATTNSFYCFIKRNIDAKAYICQTYAVHVCVNLYE